MLDLRFFLGFRLAKGHGNTAWLQSFRRHTLYGDSQQTIIQFGIANLDMISQNEASFERAGRNTTMQQLTMARILRNRAFNDEVIIGQRHLDIVGAKSS